MLVHYEQEKSGAYDRQVADARGYAFRKINKLLNKTGAIGLYDCGVPEYQPIVSISLTKPQAWFKDSILFVKIPGARSQ